MESYRNFRNFSLSFLPNFNVGDFRMPTYDYKCNNCNYTFELFQKMTDEPIKECPKCKGQVIRLIGTGAGPIFKGSGFYQTDYKNNGKNDKSPAKKENKTETKK